MSVLPSLTPAAAKIIAKGIHQSLKKSNIQLSLSQVQEVVAHAWGARNFDTLCAKADAPAKQVISPGLDAILLALSTYDASKSIAALEELGPQKDDVIIDMATPRISPAVKEYEAGLQRPTPSSDAFDYHDYQELVDRFPEFMSARLTLGAYHANNGDMARAIQEWEQIFLCGIASFVNGITSLAPTPLYGLGNHNPFLWANAGANIARCHLDAGAHNEAFRILSYIYGAIEDPPQFVIALLAEALLYKKALQLVLPVAGKYYRNPKDPEMDGIFFSRIIASVELHMPDQARKMLNKGIVDYPHHVEYILDPTKTPPEDHQSPYIDNRGPLAAWKFINRYRRLLQRFPAAVALIEEVAHSKEEQLKKAAAKSKEGFLVAIEKI